MDTVYVWFGYVRTACRSTAVVGYCCTSVGLLVCTIRRTCNNSRSAVHVRTPFVPGAAAAVIPHTDRQVGIINSMHCDMNTTHTVRSTSAFLWAQILPRRHFPNRFCLIKTGRDNAHTRTRREMRRLFGKISISRTVWKYQDQILSSRSFQRSRAKEQSLLLVKSPGCPPFIGTRLGISYEYRMCV